MNHKLLADLCAASYEGHTFKKGDVEVLHHETEQAHIYAIRGTEFSDFFSGRGWMDVIRDIAFWPKSTGNTYGHAGFVHGWHEIEKKLITHYHKQNLKGAIKPMVLTGHSMGGAIALAGGYKTMLEHDIPMKEIVTFGAPPCLDPDYIEPGMTVSIEAVTKQYQHVSDPIPETFWYTSYDHVHPALVGGKFIRPFFMRRMSKHAIEVYQDVMGV